MSTQLHLRHKTLRQRGASLVEVLVTVVVISVGLLGVAALNLTSLRNSFDANSRTKAALLANDIADRMRANAVLANPAITTDASPYEVAFGANKTGSTIVDTDVIAWKALLARDLPNGDGSIASAMVGTAASPVRLFTISVRWSERDNAMPSTLLVQTGI